VPDNDHPLVHIRVAVNVNSMRRGQELRVPLTEHIEGLSLAGYIQILGHVNLSAQAVAIPLLALPAEATPPAEPPAESVESEPVEVVPLPVKPKRVRPKAVVSGGGSEGSP
jgi:hypothetical protein